MQYRTLGSSGLLVSPVCLGTMTFGSPVTEAAAVRLVHGAIEQGINFIDTANVYEGYDRFLGSPGGVAEAIVGKAVRDRSDQVVIATKVCAPVGPGPQDRGLSASHILREIDRSLTRLQTDYIDLYIVHWPDRHTPLETTMAALDQVVRSGKARYIGASNHNDAQLCEMLWIAERTGGPRVVSSQVPFSLLRREFHHDLDFCARHSIGVTPYQPLQGGLLTGKYRRGQAAPADSRLAEKPAWMWDVDDVLYERLEAFEAVAAEAEITPARLALAWTLRQRAMASVIVGVKTQEQIDDAVAAAEVSVPDAVMQRLDEICPPPWTQPDPVRGM